MAAKDIFSMKSFVRTLCGASVVFLTACQTPPPTIVQQPMTARPQSAVVSRPSNGSIYQAAATRPLFEDQVPRQVGDILTVIIQESSSVANSEESKGSRSASSSAGVTGFDIPFFPDYLEEKAKGLNLGFNGASSANGSGTSKAASSFNSNISLTVIDVLPNGNLQVSGEKQVKMNGEMQFIRLSGIVNPRDIRSGNTVSSQKIADARIEQINQGNNNAFAQPGWLSRIFMSILPF